MTKLIERPAICRSLVAGMAAMTLVASASSVPAADIPLAPLTKLRVTVVQWMPMKGAYERWDALGGDFTVSEESNVVLPVIGAVPVGSLDGAGLAAEISRRLKASMGTVNNPDTTVEIIEYPPVYVVGDVNAPGAYSYRAGMTALQALALGGGELRQGADQSRDEITLVGDLQSIEGATLRSTARIARLRAEMAGKEEIDFPPVPPGGAGEALAAEVFSQERTIFLARANELERQAKSLAELRELLHAEISVLGQKIVAVDAAIATAEKELDGVTILVEKGLAVASRKSDLELALANHRANRLDQVTAVMRARQSVAETTRNLDGLHDRRQTDIASEMQSEQATLEQTLLKRDVTQKLLLELLSSRKPVTGDSGPSFTVLRQEAGNAVEVSAQQTTPLRPGDVVKVSFGPSPAGVSSPATSRPVEELSQ